MPTLYWMVFVLVSTATTKNRLVVRTDVNDIMGG